MTYKLLVINPGSTSTKVGVYEDENKILEENILHSSEDLKDYKTISDQLEFRKNVILKLLKEKNIEVESLNSIVGRGGLLKPIESGTYYVNDIMERDLKIGVQGEHASNLGGIIAKGISEMIGVKPFVVDPVVVDELEEVARVTGIPEIERVSIFHALNQKAIARRYAKERNKGYKDCNLIVVHMGGGVTVGAHKKGRVIDVNNGIYGEGPLTPERSGAIPALSLIDLCFSGIYSKDEVKKKIIGKGGGVAHLKTNNFKVVEELASSGDERAKLVIKVFIYQVAKEIGSYATVLNGQVDAIILTGGIAYSKVITKAIEERVKFISEVLVYPGEDELLALAEGALRVLRGEEEAKEYK